jgi:hypothetical protein
MYDQNGHRAIEDKKGQLNELRRLDLEAVNPLVNVGS